MNVYKNLMFLHGHFAHPRDADGPPAPAAQPTPTPRTAPRTDALTALRSTTMNLFKSLMYLGGLESVSLRIDEPDDAFGPTYGNRVAAERSFGRAPAAPAPLPPAPERSRCVDRFDLDACAAGAYR